MKLIWIVPIALTAVAGLGGGLVIHGGGEATANHRPPLRTGRVAANGVIEGARPEIALRPEVAGIIAAIPFRENQDVPAGTVLVELRNESQKFQVDLARAEVGVVRAQYLQARAEADRSHKLGAAVISRERFDADYYKAQQAQARLEEAEARLRVAQADFAKTRLTAPTAGRVLRVYAEPGEYAAPTSAQPVLLLADVSRRRVRAFVEELDALKIQPGQPVEATVDGLPDRVFTGKIAEVLPRMGKRSTQSEAPDEYKDVYYREAVIDLANGSELALNLRVKVHITVHSAEKPQ